MKRIMMALSLAVALLNSVYGQSGQRMQDLLRPYLDPEFAPAEGPDKDKAFITEQIAGIRAALPDKLLAGRKPKVLLLTTGTMGPLHSAGAAGLVILLRESAAKHGAFELQEAYGEPASLDGFDAVVLNNVSQTSNAKFYSEILPAYLRAGGGLLAVHGAALPFWKQPEAEYNRLLGGYVDERAKYGHPGKHVAPFPVFLPDPTHPLVAGFTDAPASLTATHQGLAGMERRSYRVNIEPPRTLADELYVLLQTKDQEHPPHVLVEVDKASATQVYPDGADDFTRAVTWIKPYGQGRVFYTQFGHNMAVFTVPAVARSILDGLLYVAGGAARAAGAADPIFPYFYGKFPGHEQRIKVLGYTPTPHLLTQLNCTKQPPYNVAGISAWMRTMAKAGPGFVFVKVDDLSDEATAIRLIRETADVAAEVGFTVVFYPYTGTPVDSAERALPLVEKIDHPRVGLTLHLPQEIKGGNARRFPEIIAKVKDHIKLVIVCGADLPQEGDNPLKWLWSRLIRPLGEGDFDVGAFVRAVRATGYEDTFGQICWGIAAPAEEYLPRSMEFWNKITADQPITNR